MPIDKKLVSLRPVNLSDAGTIHEWASQDKACRFQSWGPNSEAETALFAQAAVDAWDVEPQRRWVWTVVHGSRVVGIGEAKRRTSTGFEITYGVHTDLWGQGVGTAIGTLLIDWIFGEWPAAERIEATCDPRNIGSEKVLRRIGMSYEGTLRHTMTTRDGWRDSKMFSILRHERSIRRVRLDTEGSEPVNIGNARGQVAWRMDVAMQVAERYENNNRLAAFTVAGSVGTGLADRWSDLELDCYWFQPPTARERRDPIDRVGGVLEAFWDYDEADQEWSEDYRLQGLDVTVSNFTVSTVQQFLQDVVNGADTDAGKHMRLSALQRCEVLRGSELICAWRSQADQYPDRLIDAIVEQSLTSSVLTGWSARYALAERGDDIALHELLSSVEQAVLATVLALNKIYRPHQMAKWQRHLVTGLQIAPERFAERLQTLWHTPDMNRFIVAETLLAETLELVEKRTRADVTPFRATLAERRSPAEVPERTRRD